MNSQKPLPFDGSQALKVHSIFYTIQGEGPFSGRRAFFIRLHGCNLQCPECDTIYTSPAPDELLPEEIIKRLDGLPREKYQPRPIVVITGGEPFRQNLTGLFLALVKNDYIVQVETNGSLAPSWCRYKTEIDGKPGVYLICSPKTHHVNMTVRDNVLAYKYVLDHRYLGPDGLPNQVLMHPTKHDIFREPGFPVDRIYIQPADNGYYKENVKAVVESSLTHGYIAQLQIHKLLGVD